MLKILLVTAFLSVAGIHAHAVQAVPTANEVDFLIPENNGDGSSTYYRCDGLEELATSMLKKMGATDVHVMCSGGLEDNGYWGAPSINARFTSARLGQGLGAQEASYSILQLTGNENCNAAQAIFAAVEKKFDLQNVTGAESFCGFNASYNIRGHVLRF